MQPLQYCIGPTIRIGHKILCLPYAGFFVDDSGRVNNILQYGGSCKKKDFYYNIIFIKYFVQ